ncbi:MAG TPA: M1 family aminopeptidase [Candidatus Polarisedimenticolia bacterium]|nr:M1 family aminopeptidase [Candidatus Polarisedimenticolia bacterium]
MERVFDAFFSVGLDLDRPRTIKDFRLKRDTMELTFSSGTLYLTKPVGGMVTGAYYTGSGTMKATVPNAFDRKLLVDDYGKAVFQESFDQLALRFDDGSEKDILAASTPGGMPIGGAADAWANRMRIQDNSGSLQVDFLESRINSMPDMAFFTAAIHTPANEWYSFSHRGRAPIENSIRREKLFGAAGKRWYETVSAFHRPEDYDAKGNYDLPPEADNKMPAAMNHIEMTVTIPNTKSVLIDAMLTAQALRDGVRFARFDFINNTDAASWDEKGRPVTVQAVQDDAGHPLPYLHREHQLLVLLPRPLNRGETARVRVQATEDTIVQLTTSSYWIYSGADWYPRTTSGSEAARHTFDWTVKVAKPMQSVGSGDLKRTWDEGDLSCGQWASTIPVRYASFIFGGFKLAEDRFQSEIAGGASIPLRLYTIHGGGRNFKGKPENVLYNIKEGMRTYESVLGPFPFGDLDIAEMAGGLGFAHSPPGILLISGALDTAGGGGYSDQVIFHELAHQWWGHQVGRASIEDAWISESWAEYTSELITEAIDKKKAKSMRDEWREGALEVNAYGGTISTAYRSSNAQYRRAWTSLLYDKGPCVLHMLRTWMGWEKFTQYVSTLQSKYRNMNINTDTLAREASQTLGYDMLPFFDQWVRGDGIPKVHYSWTTAPEAGGKQIVTIKLHQEDEANFKVLMLPIGLDFGTGTPTIVPKLVLKAATEIQLRVPQPPRSITMDPSETQLAIFINDDKKK